MLERREAASFFLPLFVNRRSWVNVVFKYLNEIKAVWASWKHVT